LRDIRSDLKERLAAAEAQRAQLVQSLDDLDEEVRAIQSMLEIEDQRDIPNGHAKKRPSIPLEDFIVLKAKQRPMSKEDLRLAAVAEGFDVNGRHIHGHLMKLLRDQVVRENNDGCYVA